MVTAARPWQFRHRTVIRIHIAYVARSNRLSFGPVITAAAERYIPYSAAELLNEFVVCCSPRRADWPASQSHAVRRSQPRLQQLQFSSRHLRHRPAPAAFQLFHALLLPLHLLHGTHRLRLGRIHATSLQPGACKRIPRVPALSRICGPSIATPRLSLHRGPLQYSQLQVDGKRWLQSG